MINKFLGLALSKSKGIISGLSNKLLKIGLESKPSGNESKNKIEYLLILDFEATCDKSNANILQEVIEFPCLKVDLKTMKEMARFHYYVKPILYPDLTSFCTQLTGILQETVNDGITFSEAYKLFEEWRTKEGLTAENSLYVTSGDWDLGWMMPSQCKLSGLELPQHMREWIDIKKFAIHVTGVYNDSLIKIIRHLGIESVGRAHSGIDDCINIHNVVKELSKLGAEFRPTSKLIITDSKKRIENLLVKNSCQNVQPAPA